MKDIKDIKDIKDTVNSENVKVCKNGLFPIKEFKFDKSMLKNPAIIMIAKRNTGSSWI